MANIDEQMVAETINKLRIAGKTMPQMERMRTSSNPAQTAIEIFSETVQLWAGIFVPRNIGAKRWEAATNKALTMGSVDGLNINMITPTLMEAALRQVEREHMQLQEERHEQEKKAEAASIDDYQNRILWRWTTAKLAQRREIMPYMPKTAEHQEMANEVVEVGRRLGLNYAETKTQANLIKIYLNEQNYAAANQEQMPIEIYLRPDRRIAFRAA